jgi:two-component system, OmpR family, sensor kinase
MVLMRGPRTLRSRLFSWFVGAILLAALASALVATRTRPDSMVGAEAAARHIGARLAASWGDPASTAVFVDEFRDVTGFDARLVRDPNRVGPHVRRLGEHGAFLVPQGPQRAAIPVVRGGEVVGALEIEGLGAHAWPWGWWRPALSLLLALGVLSGMAGAVANQLARPLERLARAADRLGAGDLAFRTDVAGGGQRWVAREVRDVAVSFNRMADRLEAMVRGQRELLGAISHELRSPMGRAHVALEIARDRLQTEAPGRAPLAPLDDVERELGVVDSILGDLLDVTRAGLADLRKDTQPLAAWLERRVAAETDLPPVNVAVDSDARDTTLPFDAALLGRVIHNLLVNAPAHGHPADTPLEVRLARGSGGATLRVTVRDRGPGFAPGFAERAFEPFVRGDAARSRPRAGSGYGLGLAIVRRIVEAHGGRVFARNVEGGGAEVGFELPARPEAG